METKEKIMLDSMLDSKPESAIFNCRNVKPEEFLSRMEVVIYTEIELKMNKKDMFLKLLRRCCSLLTGILKLKRKKECQK